MDRPVILSVGNCVTSVLIEALRAFPRLVERYELHASMEGPNGRPSVAAPLLARCALLIEQHYSRRQDAKLSAAERAALPASHVAIRVPLIGFTSLWPLICADPRNRPVPGFPWGRYRVPSNDRLALGLVDRGLDPTARVAAYHAIDVATVVDVGRHHEVQAEQMVEDERTCDIRLAPYVVTHFRRERLFFNNHHPSPALLRYLLAEVVAHPQFARFRSATVDAMLRTLSTWLDQRQPFVGEDVPINPRVARSFKLVWWVAHARLP